MINCMMFHINILQVLMSKLLLPSPKSITNCTRRCRLYRAQRLYVQLLSKSMLLAILIGNVIRLQSIITLCPENVFFMSYFTRHKGCMSISRKSSEHKGYMSFSRKSSEHKGCMSTLSSTRIGLSVIIHDVNSRQDGVKSVGMLRPEGLMALTNENISRGCSTSSVLRRD